MKKLFLIFCLLLMCASVRATSITLSAYSAPQNWQYGTPATLRIYVNGTFVDSDGIVHMAQATGGPNFYQSLTCTVSGGTVTIPSFTIASTINSPTNPNATYSFIFYDKNGVRRDTFAASIKVPIVLGTTITWGSLLVYNSTHPNPPGPQFPDVQQVIALIGQNAPSVTKATTTAEGIGLVSVAPAVTAHPKFVGDNDLRVVPDQAANVGSPRTLGSGALQAVPGNDARVTADQAANVASIRTLGTGALQATAGNDARLSDNRAPLVNTTISETLPYSGDGSLIVGKNVKLDGSANAVLTAAGDSGGMVGTVISGGTNTVTVAKSGRVTMTSDGGALVAGRYAQISASQAGCITAVVGYPTNGQVLGRILVGGTSPVVDLFGTEVRVAATTSSVFNVKDYGAVCNVDLSANTGTDDATAIGLARAAAETAGGGTLYFPGRCATSAQLVLTKPLTLTGAFKGAGLYATSAFSTSTAIVTYKPAAFPYNDGWTVDNMTIGSIKNQENSLNAGEWGCVGGFAGCSGGDAIYIDSSLAPGAGVLNVTVKNSWLLPTGGWGIHAAGGNTNGTPARSRFVDNLIYDGVWMPEAGDTVEFRGNTMLGRNKAFEVTSVAGATTFMIEKNNITQPGGMHFGGNTYKLIVRANIIELYKYVVYGMVIGSVGSNGAIIDLDGATTKHLTDATIEDNVISALDGSGFGFDAILLDGVRVNYSDRAWVGMKERYFNPSTYKGIVITANATKTELPPKVVQDGGGSTYTDAGTDTRQVVSTDNGTPLSALGSAQVSETMIFKTSAIGISATHTTGYSITPTSEQTQIENSTSAGFTATVPVGSNFPAGKILTFINIGTANAVTVSFSGGDTNIDGSTSAGTFSLAAASRVSFQFNGSTAWIVIGK